VLNRGGKSKTGEWEYNSPVDYYQDHYPQKMAPFEDFLQSTSKLQITVLNIFDIVKLQIHVSSQNVVCNESI
jgi:hypothetical protein